ncbi:MAG: hypothetical protein EPN48_04255 [Microbacteriaceae bacterium]|nr:MAG: hypothetical protein EPN48_04255 [Microbacteriaceae bacterium]
MKGKLLFVAGAAVGYVFGARAGRKRYEQIKSAAQAVWQTDGVQHQLHQVQGFAAQRVGEVPGALFNGAKKVFATVSGLTKDAAPQPSAPRPPSERPTTAETAPRKPAAKRPGAKKKPSADAEM